MRECFGSESLSQRYLFSSELKALYPDLQVIVHDDACHLHKYASARAQWSHHAATLSPPRLKYVCDRFHMTGHVDAWCLAHCLTFQK
eukprot:4371598-Karenia_brevis.AAC.1